jgi:hypothetical protein
VDGSEGEGVAVAAAAAAAAAVVVVDEAAWNLSLASPPFLTRMHPAQTQVLSQLGQTHLSTEAVCASKA